LGISADSDKLNWGYAWGSNDANQLGTTVSGNKLVPTRIDVATSNVQTWSQLSAGENHSLGISTDSDKLNWGYAWGLNFNDQLGTTVSGNKLVPTRIDVATSNVQTWSQLSASSNYSLGISADSDKLNWGYAWGNNDRNQLGTTVSGNKLVPTRIDVATSNVQTWSQLSTGGLHSLGISADLNKLNWAYSWGGNDKGQTGLGLQSGNQTKPAKINLNFNQLPNKWLFIDAGAEHSLAISSHNFGWAWGSGLNGKLGNGSNNFQPIPTEIIGSIKWNKLSAGKNHSQGIDDNQNSWGWGSNEQNQLGLGSIYPTFNKIPIKMGLKTELSNFVQISTSNTSVTAFFQNQNTSHSLAIDSLGRAWAWGDNFYGQLGNDLSGGTSENYESPPDSSVPVLVEVPLGHSGIWVQVSAGKDHSVGIDSYGQGWAWGSNYSGQLGNGSTTQRSVPTRIDVATSNVQTWLRLSAGEAYTLGISADSDKLNWGYAWGSNDGGKLGTTVSGNKLVPTRIDVATSNVQTWSQLSAGRLHSLGISADSDKLNWGYAWGSNSDGILGNGTSDSSLYPIRISSIDVQTWLQLYAGYSQSFGISADSNKLNWGYGWGWNGTFQLGNGTQNQTSLPTRINFNSVQTWSQIAPGFVHTLGIAADPDKLNWGYAWGINDAGQLGIGNEIIGESSIPIKIDDSNVSTWFQFSAGDSLSLGISADPNAAWSWGSNRKGQTGLELESGNQFFPVQIQNPISFEGDFISGSAGSKHTILIDIDGKIYTAGSNALGQLGLGNVTIDSEFFTEIEFPSQDSGWVYASAGHQHTVAIDEETGLWSWGSNDSGQLGLGTEEDPIYDPTLSPYLIAWQRTLVSSEIARTKFIRRYGLSPINPNLKLFSTTPGSNQAWIPAGNGSSQLILWRRGIDNEEI
jgi:alpha-tubulin suppressor-like RCC1 family protein